MTDMVQTAAEYLVLTIHRRTGMSADDLAELVSMDPAAVDRLLRSADLTSVTSRRAQLDAYTAGRCRWRCRRCAAVGVYTVGLEYARDHYARAHPQRRGAHAR